MRPTTTVHIHILFQTPVFLFPELRRAALEGDLDVLPVAGAGVGRGGGRAAEHLGRGDH